MRANKPPHSHAGLLIDMLKTEKQKETQSLTDEWPCCEWLLALSLSLSLT